MSHEWISARDALRFVAKSQGRSAAILAICRRAHLGMLAAKAAVFSRSEQLEINCAVPPEFWWAEGGQALEQDWGSGDFSTWLDQKVHLRASDLSFDFIQLVDLVAAEDRADAIGEISVIGHSDWIAARAASRLVLRLDGVIDALRTIVEHSATGRLVARAHRMTAKDRRRSGAVIDARIEWDVPLWFWRDFSPSSPPYDLWAMDKAFGAGDRDGEKIEITLQGLHFHIAGLVALGVEGLSKKTSTDAAPRGRPPEKFWEPMIAEIAGQIFRGDLLPKRQSEIEAAMNSWLEAQQEMASEASVRKRAKLLWDEVEKG